ncbi:hypothetical protein MVEN_00953400 [Mycena venus]|uniref:Uncharacterized protein n=1 Tax=Mycena venus TaxID=2733690 RepID=A0A8H6Y8D9_9AGAR|nr:hypothetical protein MVEN_00953400 [Mycena venus]
MHDYQLLFAVMSRPRGSGYFTARPLGCPSRSQVARPLSLFPLLAALNHPETFQDRSFLLDNFDRPDSPECGVAQNLPREILDLFVGEFQRKDRVERRTIGQFGLVCQNWLPSSRYHLFGDVDLNEHTLKPFLSAADNSLFRIPSFIQSLGLSFADREDRDKETMGLGEILCRLGALPLVKTLRLTMKDDVLVRNYTLLGTTFPNTSSLVLRNVPLALGTIFQTISAFPSVERVALDWVELESPHDALLSSYQFPPKWSVLSLDLLHDHSERHLFTAFLSLNPVPALSSLSLRDLDIVENSPIGRYLSHIGNALHHLRLESEVSTRYRNPHPTGLRFCTGLRRLDLALHESSDLAATTLSFLSYLPVQSRPTLTHINVFDPSSNRKHRSTNWRRLDNKLAEEQFVNSVKVFSVESKSPALLEGLAESMILAQQRRILRVVEAR